MNEENGLEILVDAYIKLKRKPEFNNLKLLLTGGKTADDNRFINKQIRKLKKVNILQDVEFVDDFRTSVLNDFFNKISVLSVPVLKGEAFGLYLLEALASGIPIVQPDLAAFPEIVEVSGAGVVYHPNTADALAEKLAEVLSNPDGLKEMSINGRKAVDENFNLMKSTEKLIEIYRNVISSKP
jgi:glycosyltransferase involved in cell wall biosynthesis